MFHTLYRVFVSLDYPCMLTTIFFPFSFFLIIGEQCEGTLTSPENKCFVMDGRITLYSNEPVEEGTIILARQSIQDNMIAGKFNKKVNDKYVIQNVVGLRYSALNPDALENDDNNLSRSGRNGPPAFVYVLLSVGVVILLAAFVLYRRIRNQEEEDDSQNYSDGGVLSEKYRGDDKTARSDLTPPEEHGTVGQMTQNNHTQQPLTVYTPAAAYRDNEDNDDDDDDDDDDDASRSSDIIMTRPANNPIHPSPHNSIYEPL
jgi:hypothetical protein